MSETEKPVFHVDPYANPVLVRITGRASFLNSASLKEFFATMIRQGRTSLAVDFNQCTSMDSTFLGVLAGAALELRRQTPPGNLVLVRINERNLELIRNLGMHRLATVDPGGQVAESGVAGQPLTEQMRTEIERTRLVLEAHENLLQADPGNAARFQDLLTFLRNQLNAS